MQKFQTVEESHLSQILEFFQTYIMVLKRDQDDLCKIQNDLQHGYSVLTIDKLLDTFALSKYTGLEKPSMLKILYFFYYCVYCNIQKK